MKQRTEVTMPNPNRPGGGNATGLVNLLNSRRV